MVRRWNKGHGQGWQLSGQQATRADSWEVCAPPRIQWARGRLLDGRRLCSVGRSVGSGLHR